MVWLKQSTAVDVVLGVFVDDADGKTVETGLTISQADCQLTKNGGAVAQKNDATSASHLGGGHYKVPLNTTDTNTLGRLRLYVNEGGALPVWHDFMVVPANVYDSLVAGSDTLQGDVTQIAGAAVSTSTAQLGVNAVQAGGTAWGSGAITAGAIAADALTAAKFAADVTTELQSGLATAASLATVAGYLDTEIAAILAAVDTEIGAIKAVTDTLTLGAIADALWDEVLEGALTGRQFMRVFLAVMAGQSTGGGTSTVAFRDVADAKDRVAATIDGSRNRTAVTLDGS